MKTIKDFSILVVVSILFTACAPSVTSTPVTNQVTSKPLWTSTVQETPVKNTMVVETEVVITTPPTPQASTFTPEEEPGPAKGIILFIGDGMGANHRLSAQWLALGQGDTMAMDNLAVRGMMETSPAGESITDSAAAATAFASGVRTANGMVGMQPGNISVETILEQAQAHGWAVGLVTTTSLTHATPAAFAAHVSSRYKGVEIAKQMMALGVDVLLGGGEDDFLPFGARGCFPNRGHRGDGLNLIDNAIDEGYTFVCDGQGLLTLDTSRTLKLIGFFGDDGLKQPYNPTLADMTRVAIEILSLDPDGFFLMVEGGQIDWEAEDNHARETMQLTVGLNAAVTMALVYAMGEPNTLIIVTADHETGGMSLNQDCGGSYRQDGPFLMPDGTGFCVDWSTNDHTAADVPVTAQGPWSWMLYGEYPNTWIYQVMYAALTGEGIGSP